MANMFNGLAKMIVKHHRAIIIIWILALVVALPFAPLASDAVVYDDTSDPGIKDQPSVKAQGWISDRFGQGVQGNSIIVVLSSPDVTDDATKSLVSKINLEMLQASPSFGGVLSGNASVSSVYGINSIYSTSFLSEINGQYFSMYNYTEIVQGALFGIPLLHLRTWEVVNSTEGPSTPVWVKDGIANSITSGLVQDIIVNSTFILPEERNMMAVYEHARASTANETALVDRPGERMKNVAELAFAELLSDPMVRSMPANEVRYLVAVNETFNFENVGNETLRKTFVIDQLSTQAQTEPWLIFQVVEFGPVKGEGKVNFSVLLKITNLANDVVSNSSLSDFPLPLIPATLQAFIDLPSNDTMVLLITLSDGGAVIAATGHDIQEMRDIVQGLLLDHPDVRAYVTGNDAIRSDTRTAVDQDIARIDPITIMLVLVLIGLFFRSPVASSVPPAIIGFALGMSFAVVYFIGTYVMDVNYSVLTLIVTATLGAGCDYCIFVISRYREERRNGADRSTAVETAVTWAGEAIAISGATVIIGFGALALSDLHMIKSMSILAFSILMALLIALTFLPSLLMVIGDRIVWPSKIRPKREGKNDGYFTRSARFAIKYAKIIALAAVLISIPTTYIVMTANTSYDYIAAMPNSDSKQGLDVLDQGFGGGTIDPTSVGVSLSLPLFNATGEYDLGAMNAIENLSQAYASVKNVHLVKGPTRPYGEPIDYQHLSGNTSIQARLYDQYIRQMMVGKDDRSVLLTIVLEEEPFSQASLASINEVRDTGANIERSIQEIDGTYVAGSTAVTYDISIMTQKDMVVIIGAVIALIFLILMLVMGSVLSPVRSIITILISISWTLAVTILFFENFQGVQIMWMVPMVLVVVCLGLGMDYDILLTTRVREETDKGRTTNEAIVHSVERTGWIITACGIIMASAFGSMMLSQGALLREFGFALMFAILLDATVVRIYLVPAIMSLLGKWNWWAPGRLQRTRTDHLEDVDEDGTMAEPAPERKERT
jgi:RND superfamily putative drug exporter